MRKSEPKTVLRIGIVLDGMQAPAWAAWALKAIRAHDGLELTLAVISNGVEKQRRSVLFALYEALDRRVFRDTSDALEPLDVSPALEGVPILRLPVLPEQTQKYDHSLPEMVSDGSALDVLVCIGTPLAPAALPFVVQHGIWYLHLGDPRRNAGEPALFWEVFLAEPASKAALEAVDQTHGEHRVLYRSATATDPISLHRTRNAAYWKSARFVVRRLEDLAAGRWAPDQEPADDRGRQGRMPSNADAARHMARLAGRVTKRKLRSAAYRRQWFLGVRRRRADTLPHEDPNPWQVVSPPADRQWADPFVFERDGETLVFFEQLRYADTKGELAVARLERDAELSDPEPIMRAPHHLSYPYVFRDDGDTFMIPESGEAGRVELWAATDFPTGWTPVEALLEGVQAVDASVLRHGGLYWMWVNQAVNDGRLDDETFLYFSDRLDSGWTAHPGNPVVSDARCARPAGRPFLHGDVVIRPAQDGTGRYGSRVVFNAVEVLTPDEYRERSVGSLDASWAGEHNLCAHTYTFDGRFEATDGRRLVSRLRR
ncbi:MAG TPA: hypothetical protein VIZ61_09065 [Solirubrobacterales bacterium]